MGIFLPLTARPNQLEVRLIIHMGFSALLFLFCMEKREIAILLSFCEKKLKKNPATILNTYLGISNLNYSMAETEVALFL